MDASQFTARGGAASLSERAFLALLGGIVGLRVISLLLTPLSLHPDEAQYWAWSRELAWGYFSKPPLIAWIIAATTSVFGNAEWAARLASPMLHGLTAWLLFLLGRKLFSEEVGALAGLSWLLIPSVWLSSVLVSTDAALLPMWALALLAFHHMLDKPSWRAGALLGLALGVGALAKYAMFYFVMGIGLAALLVPAIRPAVLSWRMGLALAIAGAIIAPNLIWNATNDFATLGHTVANANIGGGEEAVNVEEAGGFFLDQIAMAGLLTIAFAVLAIRFALKRQRLPQTDLILLAFIIPPLAVIFVQSFLSRAHANWAATAYPALVLLTVAWLARLQSTSSREALRTSAQNQEFRPLSDERPGSTFSESGLAAPGRRGWLWAAMGVHAALFAVFAALIVSPGFADSMGLSNALKRLRGWDVTAEAVAQRFDGGGYQTILVDHRHLFFQLYYQWRDRPDLQLRLRMWVLREAPGNHAELMAPMRASDPTPALSVHLSPHYQRFLAGDFQGFTDLGGQEAALGGGQSRALGFGRAEGFNPRPRTAEMLAEIGR